MFAAYLVFKMFEWSIKCFVLALLAMVAMCVWVVLAFGVLVNPRGGKRALRDASRTFGRAFRAVL